MDTTSYLALGRQVALQRHMTRIATNIANLNTTGYRAEHSLFEQLRERVADGYPPIAFVQDRAFVRDLSPGPITQTGNPRDVALDGPGYLAFSTPQGIRYGRAGHLEVDATGQLADAQGDALLDDAGNAVVLPSDDRAITIAADGTISGRAGAVARIGLVAFANEQALEPIGGGLYTTDQPPVPASGTRVVPGALEGSNVQPVLEMTTMLETVRAFEGASRLLETQHELERQSIERTIRVGG
jgi:flagellar basal-body rod protein FlgF